ncbi:MAG: hypothetical protein A2138_10040 [Deltaproteobacteria bacterium RBG_16_71_12]|nr:MAG: hypothetical protein A2138_10040 [Deltaproteobacteria bacterium RBG_16_71_12]
MRASSAGSVPWPGKSTPTDETPSGASASASGRTSKGVPVKPWMHSAAARGAPCAATEKAARDGGGNGRPIACTTLLYHACAPGGPR